MFHPGETIKHTFTLPFERNELRYVIVSYKQNDKLVLERLITSRHFEDYEETETHVVNGVQVEETVSMMRVSVIFSQEESLLFDDDSEYTIQLNAYGGEGPTRLTSQEIKASSGTQLHREVISESTTGVSGNAE